MAVAIAALLTLAPFLNILRIVVTKGENVLSNDYVLWVGPVTAILGGGYDWRSFPRDAFHPAGHFMPFPLLLHVVAARFTHWNIFGELYFGLWLFAVKLILLHRLLAPRQGGPWSLWLWPVLSGLVFSTSQISTFTFGDSALQMGLNQVSILLGLGGLLGFPGRWPGVLLASVGGLVAAWSWGGGVFVFPLFLLVLWVLEDRRWAHFAVVALTAAVASIPYLAFLVLSPRGGAGRSALRLFNVSVFVNTLGRPLSRNIGTFFGRLPASEWRGAAGLILLFAGGLLLFRRIRKHDLSRALSAAVVTAYAVLCSWQISLFRDGVVPWYTMPAMLFWVGLVGFAWIPLSTGTARLSVTTDGRGAASRLWAAGTVLFVAVIYLRTNWTWADKSFYLASRGPASASCMRHWREAPTYCEQSLFLWFPGHPEGIVELAEPLERQRLSVFAPRQIWSLQGEWGSGNVTVNEDAAAPGVRWIAADGRPVSPLGVDRLDLLMPASSEVLWQLLLPAGVTNADFLTMLVRGSSGSEERAGRLLVTIEPEGEVAIRAFDGNGAAKTSRTISVSLERYSGRAVTLRLRASGAGAVALRYPHLDLFGLAASAPEPFTRLQPANTELSSLFVGPSARDFVFEIAESDLWEASEMTRQEETSGGTVRWRVNPLSTLTFLGPLDLDLGDFDHFYIRLRVSSSLNPRSVKVRYRLDGAPAFDDVHAFDIPLLSDDGEHAYTYNLGLLAGRQGRRLTGLRLDLASGSRPSPENRVWLSDVRLLRRSG